MDNSKSYFRGIALSLILSLVLICIGCKSEATRQAAYEQYYAQGHQESFQEGEKSGKEVGSKRGASNAEEDAANGESWKLYWALALIALGSGLGFGLVSQYGVMWRCRKTGRLPLFSTVTFIPAMKSSKAYSILISKRDVKINFDEQLWKLALRKNLRAARIQELNDAVTKKLAAMSGIEELTNERIAQLYEEELNKIIDLAEMKRQNELEKIEDDNILEI